MSDALLLFAKEPRPGRVKTRLAAALGEGPTMELYGAMLEDTCATAAAGDWELFVAHDPPEAAAFFAELAPSATIFPQPDLPFGERLTRGFQRLFDAGAERVLAIGADAPHVGPERLAEAFAALREHPVAIGPADDGGYWTIGLAAPWPELFVGIDWSTDRVLAQTLALTKGREALLATEFDVDDLDSLRRLQERIAREDSGCCPRTAAWLRRRGELTGR